MVAIFTNDDYKLVIRVDMGSAQWKEYYIMTNKIELKFNFPRPCVKRNDLGKLTGGLLNPKTIRNLDSQGVGIKGKFLIGPRTVAYPTDAVIDFIAERLSQNNVGQEVLAACDKFTDITVCREIGKAISDAKSIPEDSCTHNTASRRYLGEVCND